MFRPRLALLFLTAAIALGACQSPRSTRMAAPIPLTAAAKAGTAQGAAIRGKVTAPSRLAPGARSTLALGQEPVAEATVLLVDQSGAPVEGVKSAKTNALGNYQLSGVPKNQVFTVLVKFQSASGTEVVLKTLVSAKQTTTAADVTAATTIAATYMTHGRSSQLTQLSASAFGEMVSALARSLTDEALPDLADPAAIVVAVQALAIADPALRAAITEVKAAPEPTVTAAPTPTPAPTATPTSSGGSGGGSSGGDDSESENAVILNGSVR